MGQDLVIDNSVVMAWCFLDEGGVRADSILERLELGTAFVPAVWPLEVGNVLLVAERHRRLGEGASTRFLALLSELPIIVDPEPPERMFKEILALARQQKISTYDASYLDLAMRRGLPLATLDGKLKKAAQKCGVPLFPAK